MKKIAPKIIAIIFLLALLSSCVSEVTTPTIPPLDLLIDLSDMPTGWVVYERSKTGKNETAYSTGNSAYVSFVFSSDEWSGPTHQFVDWHSTSAKAKSIYKDMILPSHHGGNPPAGWNYKSATADQSYFSCVSYSNKENVTSCDWSALYNQYIVTFSAWTGQGQPLSLQDIEQLVRVIDTHVSKQLGLLQK